VNFDFVVFVNIVKQNVGVFVDVLDRFVRPEHGEALEVMLGQRTPVGHPSADKHVLYEEVGQLKENKIPNHSLELQIFKNA
jgi:hypothetical protein